MEFRNSLLYTLAIILIALLAWSLLYSAGVKGVPNPVEFFEQAYKKAHERVTGLVSQIKKKLNSDSDKDSSASSENHSTQDKQKEPTQEERISESRNEKPRAVIILGRDLDEADYFTCNEELDQICSILEPEFTCQNYRCPNDKWRDIRRALQGAEIMVYEGHGLGTDGTPQKIRGIANGLCVHGWATLYENDMWLAVSQDEIISSVRFEKGGLAIMFHACYTCGPWRDEPHISYDTAYSRVNDYSYTFLSVGANYLACTQNDLLNLIVIFEKNPDMPIGSAIEKFCGDYDIELVKAFHKDYPNACLWLGLCRYLDEYVIAYAGDPNITYNSLLR